MTKQLHAFHCDFVPNWEHAETQYLSPCRWSPNPPPHVSVQALWRDDALIFRLCSDTPPSRAVNTAQDSSVWEDNCLECFLSADGQHYAAPSCILRYGLGGGVYRSGGDTGGTV